jgi:hypothetical protein
MPLYILYCMLEPIDAFVDEAAVGLQLRFTGTSSSNASTKLLKMGPLTHKPRQEILMLGELNLELPLVSLSLLGKYVQNKSCAVYDLNSQYLLKVPLLSW